MPSQPLVTVLIPAYNAEGTIRRAIDSALRQNYRPIEIVVVDDASTDGTAAAVASYRAEEVRLYSIDANRGVAGAMNYGTERAKGEFIAFLDADDEWLDGKLLKQITVLEENPDFGFVTCGCEFVSDSVYAPRKFGLAIATMDPGEVWKTLLAGTCVAKPCVVARRSTLESVGPFDPDLAVGEDQDMWIRLASAAKVGIVPEILVRAHDTPNSLTKVYASRMVEYLFAIVERHIEGRRKWLTRSEINKILGARYSSAGRNLYVAGETIRGAKYLLAAAARRHRVAENLWYIVTASPPARRLKLSLFGAPRYVGRAPDARIAIEPPKHGARQAPAGERRRGAARKRHPMLPTEDGAIVRFPRTEPPRLVVIVDAEEEFDWQSPLSRDKHSVTTMAAQSRAHDLFRRYGVIPTYAADYPVVLNEAGYRPLMDMLQAGACEIGAQLHPWVTPPFDEPVGERTSYPGNLPKSLEHRKLQVLTDLIAERFGIKPKLYRAGRFGAGENTTAILEALGYDMDCSVVPGISNWSRQAPDYSGGDAHPYWLKSERPILELPVTAGSVGVARHLGDEFYRVLQSDVPSRLRLTGIMARAGLLNRTRLTPEGMPLQECKQLTRSLVARGYRFFAVTYHSPSLEPGHTPYVRNVVDLARFMGWIEDYLEFFFGELNGRPETVSGVYAWARANSSRDRRRSSRHGDIGS